MRSGVRPPLMVVFAIAVSSCRPSVPAAPMGAYRFDDGRILSVRESLNGTLRYRFYQGGRSGRLFPEGDLRFSAGAAFSDRAPLAAEVRFDEGGEASPGLTWDPPDGAPATARRIGADVPVAFESGAATLRGRLQLPDGEGPFPGVVLVHGSGRSVATRWLPDSDFLAAHGVAVLVYDKRGTGGSGGRFTYDFNRLAGDVVAAVSFLKERAEVDSTRIGLCGYSQGGWVAPLAARLDSTVRFVVVNYGMVESPAEEARLEMEDRMRERGVDEAGIGEADALIRAAVAVVAAGFKDGWEEFDALRKKYRGRAWLDSLDGTPVGELLSKPRWLVRWIGPRKAPAGMSWNHDSRAVLDALDIPTVWLLGERDRSAPGAGTVAFLDSLSARRSCTVRVFEGADHTMLAFREEGGRRIYTGYAPDYYRTEVEFVRSLAAAAGSGRDR